MPQPPLHTQICIIGAGPAGTTTSLFLGKKKIPHTIVDAATFPRDKVCGDALDLKVMRVLHQYDPAVVQQMLDDDNFVKAAGASILISDKRRHDFDLTSVTTRYPFFGIAKRAYFDNFLFSHIDPAYADVRQGNRVTKVERINNKWHIQSATAQGSLTIIADMIVGADGDHSTVLRSLGKRKIDRRHYCGALRQYWRGIKDLNPNNYLEIYLPKSLPLAYLWIFPLPNGEANVGCGLASDIIAAKSVDLKKLFNQLITEDPVLASRFKDAKPLEKPQGWGLPLASQQREVYGDGYLLTGDAASTVCPTTGEGIGPAMMCGYIAANFIEKAIKENRFDKEVFIGYDREIYKRLQADVRKYKLLRRISPLLYNSLIKVFAGTGISKRYLLKNFPKWASTIEKPITVNM